VILLLDLGGTRLHELHDGVHRRLLPARRPPFPVLVDLVAGLQSGFIDPEFRVKEFERIATMTRAELGEGDISP
jgi:hypothetical protein